MWPVMACLMLLAAPVPLTVPMGVTELLENPNCTVGYQRFGEQPVTLGYQWTGYDPASGVYFVPEPAQGERTPVFMHSPWIPGGGQAFADFALVLPRTGRIRLRVSTMIRPTAKGSDGVTWRVRVDGKPIWEHNGNHREWHDFEVDLTAYAGQTVTLRLEVDPGPARHSSDDWSLWGRATLCCGNAAEVAEAQRQAAVRRAAQQQRELAAAEPWATQYLSAFSQGTPDSVRPSTGEPVRNSLIARGDAYALECHGARRRVEYRFTPAQGLLDGLQVFVNGRALSPAPFTGGPRPLAPGGARLLEARLDGGKLLCRWQCGSATLAARLWTQGWSLALAVEGSANSFSGCSVELHGGEPVAATFQPGPPPRRLADDLYLAAAVDLWHSDCTHVGGGQARTVYDPLTDGSRRALRDTFWMTVAGSYAEALPNVPHRASPYLAELAHRCVLDAWNGPFAADEAWLNEMARYGVTSLLFIKHVWQRDGYDQTYPNVFPANAGQGGDAALRSLTQRAIALGHRFCVHENFYDYYPNAEDFRLDQCALDSRGERPNGWNNGRYIAKLLKPSLLMDYARRFSPEVRRRYGCDSSYHDIMPTWLVDFDAKVSESGMIRVTHQHSQELFDFDRQLYGGPVVCEAADSQMAGTYDGGCNHGVDTWQTSRAVAYELLKVHPKMSNHGFGYYERWLPWGYGPGWYTYLMTDRELDAYRAVTVAFGRTGFLGHQLMPHAHQLVREYHLMQAYGRAYTGQPVRQIAWLVDAGGRQGWVDMATATRWQQLDRLRVIYEGGQRVYANLSKQPWTIEGVLLAPDGTLTLGPRATSRTAVIDGQVADYAAYDDVIFADARSDIYQPPRSADPIAPHAVGFKDHGDGSFDIGVEWQVGRKLDRDYTVFWHFADGERIRFQWDHAPAQKTSSWAIGSTQHDGPRRFTVPVDQAVETYAFSVGLYTKDGRATLINGADGLRLGYLKVRRENGRVTGIRFEPTPPESQPGASPEPYRDGANRDHRVIDFGSLATNGAVVLRGAAGGRELVPVPVGTAMTVGLAEPARTAEAFAVDGRAMAVLQVAERGGKCWLQLPVGVGHVRLR